MEKTEDQKGLQSNIYIQRIKIEDFQIFTAPESYLKLEDIHHFLK